MSYELPTTMIGLIGLAIITFGGLARVKAQQLVQGRKINETHAQLRNDHPGQPKLRDDIEDIRAIVHDTKDRLIVQGNDLAAMRARVEDVRSDMQTEVIRATAADDSIRDQVHEEKKRSIIADEKLRLRIDELYGPEDGAGS